MFNQYFTLLDIFLFLSQIFSDHSYINSANICLFVCLCVCPSHFFYPWYLHKFLTDLHQIFSICLFWLNKQIAALTSPLNLTLPYPLLSYPTPNPIHYSYTLITIYFIFLPILYTYFLKPFVFTYNGLPYLTLDQPLPYPSPYLPLPKPYW